MPVRRAAPFSAGRFPPLFRPRYRSPRRRPRPRVASPPTKFSSSPGSPGCGKSSFVQAALLPHLLTSGYTTHASVDLSAAHDLRTFCARSLLRSTSQAGSTRLASRLADLMIVDPAAAAEFFRDFLRAELPTSAPPTPVVVEHLERLLSRDEADLLPGGIPPNPAPEEISSPPSSNSPASQRSSSSAPRDHLHFQKIADLAPDGISLFEFPISPITSRSAIADILHLHSRPPASLEFDKKTSGISRRSRRPLPVRPPFRHLPPRPPPTFRLRFAR